ncbi:MAG: hypothetical protein OQK98_14995 [Gammaproteobacteria bacterium]|nr:hypothetical protein [Gammaproteobacteria bacterium]
MAFDMYLDNRREKIDYHEEGIFNLIEDNEDFPKLNYIWREFYDSPKITPETANELVHELLALNELVAKNKKYGHFESIIKRLVPFFSAAYRGGKTIECAGD